MEVIQATFENKLAAKWAIFADDKMKKYKISARLCIDVKYIAQCL